VAEPPDTPKTSVFSLQISGRFSGTAEQVGAVPVAPGVQLDPGLLANGQGVIGAEAELRYNGTLPIIAHFQLDAYAYSGQQAGTANIRGIDLPADQASDFFLKNAFGRVSLGNLLTVGGGITAWTWGLGLLANGGMRNADWDADAARFSDPYLGDVNQRLLIATGPHGKQGVQLFGFKDTVLVDDGLRPGDDAEGAGGGIRVGDPKGRFIGLLVSQRTVEADDGDGLTANVLDVTGRWPIDLGSAQLTIEGELAYIEGKTSFAPSFDHRTRRVQQLGAALRARLHAGNVGVVFDALYASGDRNLADGEQNAFLADRNYEMGLLLYRYVTAAQTGHAPITASNPELIGVPPEDLDRFPTRGGASNTLAFFPRLYYRPLSTVEIYGGPLIALTEVGLVDPLNTNFAGGDPRNAFDGEPGALLGTELDLGVRAQWAYESIQLRAGLEGAVLFLGGAFDDASGVGQDPLMGGRFTLEAAF
jgi:hypothetical protein